MNGGRKIATLLVFLLAAVGAAAEIAVEDDLGSRVVLEKPAARIVSLAPNITEILFHIGAGDLIVGQLGLPVFVIEPRELEDIPDIFIRLGRLSGHGQQARQRKQAFLDQLGQLESAYRDARPVDAFYQIWNEPLITLNGEHLVSDVIALCGGRNVFADAGPLVPYVSIESVVRANPEVIIASGSSEERPAWLTMWDNWPMIRAVKHGHIHFISPDLMQRHSVRIIEGARRVCGYLDGARREAAGGGR